MKHFDSVLILLFTSLSFLVFVCNINSRNLLGIVCISIILLFVIKNDNLFMIDLFNFLYDIKNKCYLYIKPIIMNNYLSDDEIIEQDTSKYDYFDNYKSESDDDIDNEYKKSINDAIIKNIKNSQINYKEPEIIKKKIKIKENKKKYNAIKRFY